MKGLRDLIVTTLVLLGLIGVLVAAPFIVVLLVILAVGYLIYAVVHDTRIAQEERHAEREKHTDTASGSE